MKLISWKKEGYNALQGTILSATFDINNFIWKRYWFRESGILLWWKDTKTFNYPIKGTNQYEELEAMFAAFILEDKIKEQLQLN